MGGILKKKIEKWLEDFEQGSLSEDSRHVDYYYRQFRYMPKSQWISLAYRVYDYIISIRDINNYSFKVILSFQLNYTKSHRPYPSSLKPSLMFRDICTPPEIYLMRIDDYETMMKTGINLPYFKERTGKQVRLYETDFSNDSNIVLYGTNFSKDPDIVQGEDDYYRFVRWIDVFEERTK